MSFSLETKRVLADLFYNIATFEDAVEQARLAVTEQPLFEPYEAFKRLDRLTKGQINEEDIKLFCADNGVYCTYEEASRVIA